MIASLLLTIGCLLVQSSKVSSAQEQRGLKHCTSACDAERFEGHPLNTNNKPVKRNNNKDSKTGLSESSPENGSSLGTNEDLPNFSTVSLKWSRVYQIIVVLVVLFLSIFSEKLSGVQDVANNSSVLKRRNKFVEEIELIKAWGNSLRRIVVIEQDWKINWSSDTWMEKDNGIQTSSRLLIQYKKTTQLEQKLQKH